MAAPAVTYLGCAAGWSDSATRVTIAVETTVRAFDRGQFNACFGDDPENWSFHLTSEEAKPIGFHWYYFAAFADDRLVAVVPAFGTTYRLDTTVQGPWKKLTNRLHAFAPSLTTLRLLALGSPIAETCQLGYAPEVPNEHKSQILEALVSGLVDFGRRCGYQLFAVKDAPERMDDLWEAVMASAGFSRLPGLPTAVLKLPFRHFDDYLGSLSRSTRKDMRRKLKSFSQIRVEKRSSIGDALDDVYRLYCQTLERSDLQLERLPAEYFRAFLENMSPNGLLFLYYSNEKMIAFNLMLEGQGRLVDKYVGMDYEVIDKYSPYFNTWLTAVKHCIASGIEVYQCGQAGYEAKLRLGCELEANWQYFRHRNRGINLLLRSGAKLVSIDRYEPAVADLVKQRAKRSTGHR